MLFKNVNAYCHASASKKTITLPSGLAVIALWLVTSCSTAPQEASKSPQELGALYTDLGTQSLMRGELPQAIEDLRKAITADSKNSVAHNHLGLAYLGLGQKKLALQEFETAVKITPNYSDAYVNLGSYAVSQSNLKQARIYYQRALENLEYKMRHRALTNLAQLSLQENKTDEARTLLYQSLQANPDYCMSHFLLGSIFMRDKNPQRAAEEFKKSIVSTCASNVDGHYELGVAYFQSKDYGRAKTQMAYVIENFPQTVQAQRAGEKLKDIP